MPGIGPEGPRILLKKMLADGHHLGMKSGRGFYYYQ
jgi:3-hydroxyacyl-CoA dehydrogenase